MNRYRKISLLVVSGTLAAASALALAQPGAGGKVAFASGGVGVEARQDMLAHARQYNLHLEFAEAADGDYVSGVDVTIADAHGGNVVSTRTEGPWLLAKLPAGSYTVTARYGGASRQQQINVGQGRRHLVFRFPQDSAQVAANSAASR